MCARRLLGFVGLERARARERAMVYENSTYFDIVFPARFVCQTRGTLTRHPLPSQANRRSPGGQGTCPAPGSLRRAMKIIISFTNPGHSDIFLCSSMMMMTHGEWRTSRLFFRFCSQPKLSRSAGRRENILSNACSKPSVRDAILRQRKIVPRMFTNAFDRSLPPQPLVLLVTDYYDGRSTAISFPSTYPGRRLARLASKVCLRVCAVRLESISWPLAGRC